MKFRFWSRDRRPRRNRFPVGLFGSTFLFLALTAISSPLRAQGISSLSPQSISEGPGFFLIAIGIFPDGSVILWDGQVRFPTQPVGAGRLQGFVPEAVLRESARTGPVVDPRPTLPLPCQTAANTCVSVQISLRTPSGMQTPSTPFYIVRSAAPMADVLVRHIEVVQSVQDDYNFVPLVANKRTVARVYLGLADGSERVDEPVVVRLRGFRNGAELDGQPTIIRRVTRPLLFNQNSDRDRMNHSAAFELPLEWTAPGDLELLAFADSDIPEQNKSNNERRANLTFEPSTPFRIVHRALCIQLEGEPPVCADPGRTANPPGLEFIRKAFPLRDEDGLGYVRGGELVNRVTISLSPLHDANDAVVITQRTIERFLRTKPTLEGALTIPSEQAPDLFIFWMPELNDREPLTAFRPSTLRYPESKNVFLIKDTAPYTNQFGFESENDPANVLPMVAAIAMGGPYGPEGNRCSIPFEIPAGFFVGGEISEESAVGFDPEERQIRPSYLVNFEADCAGRNRWILPSTFESLLQSPAIRLSRPNRVDPGVSHGAPIPLALISGSFRRDGAGAEITEFVRYEGARAPEALSDSGSYCAVFEGPAGVLARHCPSLAFLTPSGFRGLEAEPRQLDEQAFVLVAPFPQGATSLALTYNGAVLTSRSASANAPTVAIISPQAGDRWDGGMQTLRWSAADSDGDRLSFTVMASRDGGESWAIVASELAASQLDFDAAQLNGGPNAMFRVLAGDGFHTATATAGPFEITARPVISAEPESITIGPVVEGFAFRQQFLLANSGSGALSVESIESDNPAFRIVDPAAPFEIPAQSLVPVRVSYFSPSAANASGVLTVRSNATNSPALRISISARTVDADTPVLQTSAASIDFGAVEIGMNRDLPLAVSNLGGGSLQAGFSIEGQGFSLAGAPAPPVTLDGIDQFTLFVRFAPPSLGAFNGTLRLTSNDPERPSIGIVLSGSGIAAAVRPSISAGGVVNAASLAEGISAGSWVTIFGQNFAASTVTWDSLIQGGALPTEVAGVRVLFNGTPAAVYFVSPIQINAQAPDLPPGPVAVRVIVNGVASLEHPSEIRAAGPAFFTIGPGARRYAAAVHLDGTLVGPPDLFGGTIATRPARPGDRVLVFGTGFGPTDPAVPSGRVFDGAAPLAGLAQVTLGGTPAAVEFAGLTGAGLNQFNLVVPENISSFGDLGLMGAVNGGQTPAGVFLTVENPAPPAGIEIVLVAVTPVVRAGDLAAYRWTAAFEDSRPKSLTVQHLLSTGQDAGATHIVLEELETSTGEGEFGIAENASVRIPSAIPPGDYVFSVRITLKGAVPRVFRSNLLPVTVEP
jgi:uncharacterized protein (TIGR03437 family)